MLDDTFFELVGNRAGAPNGGHLTTKNFKGVDEAMRYLAIGSITDVQTGTIQYTHHVHTLSNDANLNHYANNSFTVNLNDIDWSNVPNATITPDNVIWDGQHILDKNGNATALTAVSGDIVGKDMSGNRLVYKADGTQWICSPAGAVLKITGSTAYQLSDNGMTGDALTDSYQAPVEAMGGCYIKPKFHVHIYITKHISYNNKTPKHHLFRGFAITFCCEPHHHLSISHT